ncbi:hypothetical protein GE115_18165 [Agromyces sp. CFH 90414]|uniref:Cytochrome P450 n=1 Tax=Agromyces agglutinans TaxID=2662258 RepID=A0A6I2F8K2_9MICO|nr:hypothetical protein [Agromyces agglutinans]MRG61785.1 hypothetical protein [Agromyces agglutinans]
MPIITDSASARTLLADPGATVPGPDPTARGPLADLRRGVSRFANGADHAHRRNTIEVLLDRLEPAALAADAAARARDAVRAGSRDADAWAIRRIPAAAIAGALGFADPDAAAVEAEVVADAYRSGATSPAVDAAAARLLHAAGGDRPDAALRVQLVVQAHRATGDTVSRAIERLAQASPETAVDPVLDARHAPDALGNPVVDAMDGALRAAPVATTVRVRAGLRVEVALADPVAPHSTPPGELLAFGAGPRRCPGTAHALAIAGAVVGELRRADGSVGSC